MEYPFLNRFVIIKLFLFFSREVLEYKASTLLANSFVYQIVHLKGKKLIQLGSCSMDLGTLRAGLNPRSQFSIREADLSL